MTGEPDNVLREKSCLSRSSGRFIPGGCPHSTEETIRLWNGISEFDSKVTSKISIKGQVNCLLTLFVWYVFETKERGTERRVAVPRGEGGYSL